MWQEIDNTLVREWQFTNFMEAWAMASKIALLFEKMDHHPDILVGYGKLKITLTTHDAGNVVTEKDRQMAAEIDKVTHG